MLSTRPRSLWAAVLTSAVLLVSTPTGSVTSVLDPPPPAWRWPVDTVRIVAAYQAPPHAYGPGHRGIDLARDGDVVRAPAAGVVAFAGQVAGRGVITIDHGDGLVTTLEPVEPIAAVASVVARGDPVAAPGTGGHTPSGALHFGVRLHGEYINPMLLLGGVPRAVLLPCC